MGECAGGEIDGRREGEGHTKYSATPAVTALLLPTLPRSWDGRGVCGGLLGTHPPLPVLTQPATTPLYPHRYHQQAATTLATLVWGWEGRKGASVEEWTGGPDNNQLSSPAPAAVRVHAC